MKRLTVWLVDMTTPSAPGVQHTYSVGDLSDERIADELSRWVRAQALRVLGGIVDDDEDSAVVWLAADAQQEALGL